MRQLTHGGLGRNLLLVGAPAASCALLAFGDLEPGRPEVTRTAVVALLMAAWWISGVVPLAVTALLPIALFPLLGVMGARDVPTHYFNDIIALYFGGFLVALAMERWGLHRRIALRFLILFGTRPRALLMGFMAPTFFLSMWISNTATTMLMVPIVASVVAHLGEGAGAGAVRRFNAGLLLAVAYSATVGGITTPIGTVPNLSLIRIAHITFPEAPEISFASWVVFALPLGLVMLVSLWLLLGGVLGGVRDLPRLDPAVLREQHRALGPPGFEERAVLAIFTALALLWLSRTGVEVGSLRVPGWNRLFAEPEFVRDGTIAIAAAVLLFLVPAPSQPGGRLLDWETARRVPWDIILLFGGGFALASGFASSGLSLWIGERLQGVGVLPPILMLVAICLAVSLLTELTSNVATTEMILPVLAALAVVIGVHPFYFMIPATIACSFAFMLPVATPPNAIVFGTGHVTVHQMMRTGVLFNLLGVALLVGAMALLAEAVLGIRMLELPPWAVLGTPP
jgi:sodium-dependent dicarboxylate transporter 2/3/5